jgi:hypothetical protein
MLSHLLPNVNFFCLCPRLALYQVIGRTQQLVHTEDSAKEAHPVFAPQQGKKLAPRPSRGTVAGVRSCSHPLTNAPAAIQLSPTAAAAAAAATQSCC